MRSFVGNEMNGMTEEALRLRVYPDTNVFIRAFEGIPKEARRLRVLFEELRTHPKTGVTSELTLAELLAPAKGKGAKGAAVQIKRRFYLNLIAWNTFIDLQSTTRDIWIETADLRRNVTLKLPDAVHIVTAIRARCSYFMSDDRGIKLPRGLALVQPNEEGVAIITEALRA